MLKVLFVILFYLRIAIPLPADNYEVVGTELPPLMYTEDGNPEGFYMDLLWEMLTELKNIDIRIQFYPAPRMFMVLTESENTFSLGIARNEKREQLYKWVGPIYPRIFALYSLRSNTDISIVQLKDAGSFRIGVGRGYAAVDDLLNAGVPRENIEELTSEIQSLKMLIAGRIDLVVMNDVMLAHALNKEGYMWNDVKQVMILNDDYNFWFAFNKSIDDSIIQKFQLALDQLKKDGRYDTIVEKYFQ